MYRVMDNMYGMQQLLLCRGVSLVLGALLFAFLDLWEQRYGLA